MRPIPLFCALGAAALACAQTQPPVEASAAVNPAGGAATIAVRNHYTSPLVAFVFIYTLRDAEATVYSASNGNYDSAIDPQQSQPVPPGGEVKIPYYAGNRGMIPVANIEAALFADGTTFGHKDMVQTLFERRNYALVTINKMVAELKQAARNSLTRDQLIAQMQTAMNDERAAAGNNDLALLILTMRNQVFADLLNARDPSNGAFLSMDKFLPAEIESLTRRKEALAPAGAK